MRCAIEKTKWDVSNVFFGGCFQCGAVRAVSKETLISGLSLDIFTPSNRYTDEIIYEKCN